MTIYWLGQKTRATRLRVFAFGWWLLQGFLCAAVAQSASPCPQSPDAYQGYTVRRIRLETPLTLKTPLHRLFALPQQLEKRFAEIKPDLPLHEGQPFERRAYGEAQGLLGHQFGLELQPGERFRLTVVIPQLQNCNDQTREVEVVYRLYTTEFLYHLSRIFEARPEQFTRALAPGAFASTINKLLPQPFLGYNDTRGWFAGTKAALQTRSGIFDRMTMDFSGSGSSAEAGLDLSGSRGFDSGALAYAEWRLGYRYSNLPAQSLRLKEGTLLAQFFGASQPLGAQNLVFRFGGSVEGGNRQTETKGAPLQPTDLAQTGYGAVKLYLGATASHRRQTWTASYGLQLGRNDQSFRVDYLKHLVDASYSARLLWREHHPLRVSAQFNAGTIQERSGVAPIGERFFGGNAAKYFIEGDTWLIRRAPFIRSFPQNRLAATRPGTPVGGKNFVSFNLTLAQTVWQRGIVPAEIAQDAEVRGALAGGLGTARGIALQSYLDDIAEYRQLVTDLLTKEEELARILEPLPDKIENLKAQNLAPEVGAAIEAIEEDELGSNPLADALDALTTIQENKTKIGQIKTKTAGLIKDKEAYLTRSINGLTALQQALATASTEDDARAIGTAIEQLRRLDASLKEVFPRIENFGQTTMQDLQPVRAIINDAAQLDDVRRSLQRIRATRDELTANDDEAMKTLLHPLDSELSDAEGEVETVGKDPRLSNPDNIRIGIERLVIGLGALAPPLLVNLSRQIQRLESRLQAAGKTDAAKALLVEADKLQAFHGRLQQALDRLTPPPPEFNARRDIGYLEKTLDVLFREMNLVAVSPVLLFDAARLGPAPTRDFGGVRYGLGAGARFSLVTLDVTAGYAWNLNRRPGEGRGAFVFALEISDLFR
jgi:hypothetical protein